MALRRNWLAAGPDATCEVLRARKFRVRAHRLQARTRDLVDQHWRPSAALASELVRHQKLNRAQIERFLQYRFRGK